MLTEEDACSRVVGALAAARKKLGCSSPPPAQCPGFLRPGGGNGCYEYSEESVEACEKSYKNAFSCTDLAPCIVTAERNDALTTCEVVADGEGGAGGVANAGGAPTQGGAPTSPEAGAPSEGGTAGAVHTPSCVTVPHPPASRTHHATAGIAPPVTVACSRRDPPARACAVDGVTATAIDRAAGSPRPPAQARTTAQAASVRSMEIVAQAGADGRGTP